MNFSQLHCFVALADTGSFTETAYTTHMTQSAVSHALSALERELGVTLLERNNKGVAGVTGIGRSLLPHARALLAQAEAIEQGAHAARGLVKGNLRLGSIPPVSSPLLAGVLAHFRQRYPDIDVVLFEGAFQEVEEWLSSNVIDAGFVHHPTKGMESTYLATDELHVFVANGHRLHTRASVMVDDLREESLIMPRTGCELPEIFAHQGEKHRPHIRYQASEGSTILAMVREGLGVTVMPRKTLPDQLEGITAIPLEPPRALQIGLAVRSMASAPSAALLFLQTAVAWFQKQDTVFPSAR
jgi:DNA-binding transcriptional LysR family regulator